MLKLSIIIPVYNVEQYIRPCLESVIRQGLKEECYEVIVVNDGTEDRSIEMIQDLISRYQNIIVINQKNQGLSMARNNGLQVATGEYVLFIDGDDLLMDNCLSYLLNKTISSKADLVVADYIRMNDDQITKNIGHPFTQNDGRVLEKTGEDLFLNDLDPNCCYVWRTLYRREFLDKNSLRFIPNICFEDIPFTHQCYAKADLCLKVNWVMYIYRKGHVTITSTFDKKKGLDYCVAMAKTWNLQHTIQLSPMVLHKIQQDVFFYFSFMMCSASHTLKTQDMRELIDLLLQEAPDLKFINGFKQIIISFLFRQMPDVYVYSRCLYGKYVENIIFPFYHHRLVKLGKFPRRIGKCLFPIRIMG